MHWQDLLAQAKPQQRVVIGIAGVQGSGKTTLAAAVASRVNDIHLKTAPTADPVAVALPMDGFHHSRADLSAMPNPTEALHRRGAAYTFDASAFHDLVRNIVTITGKPIFAPSFDHASKDPVANSIPIKSSSRIVLIEGNYCALDREPWKEAGRLMSELWYMDTPQEVAWKRLAARHLTSGVVANEKEAWERATGTDDLNAQDIRANLVTISEVVKG